MEIEDEIPLGVITKEKNKIDKHIRESICITSVLVPPVTPGRILFGDRKPESAFL